jgi:hypothetical protein
VPSASASMRESCVFPGAYSKSCFRRPRRLNAASQPTIFIERGSNSLPSERFGVVNDALAIYFLDATIASAFVARWCAALRIEIEDGLYWVYDDGCHGSERGLTRRLERACNGRRCSLIPRAGCASRTGKDRDVSLGWTTWLRDFSLRERRTQKVG